MRYWGWNIPIRKSPTYSGSAMNDFDLAKTLGISREDLENARRLAFSDNPPCVDAGDIKMTNPWCNPDGRFPFEDDMVLNDLQVYRRWGGGILKKYIAKAKEAAR